LAEGVGRTNKQTVSSRTAKTQDKTNTTNTRTDVGRLMIEVVGILVGIAAFLYIMEKALKDY
jgi:hypothetical protein